MIVIYDRYGRDLAAHQCESDNAITDTFASMNVKERCRLSLQTEPRAKYETAE